MIRPELGQVVEFVEHWRDIKPLLAMRWAVEHGHYEADLCDPGIVCPPEVAERIRANVLATIQATDWERCP